MKPELSIVMPGIRRDNWDKIYESILCSTKKTFELIIVSPFPLTQRLLPIPNVKYLKDFGSPTRAYCLGLSLCEGELIFPTMSDDSLYIKDAIDKNIDFLRSLGNDKKNVVVCKYSESENFSVPERFQLDDYYLLRNNPFLNPQIIPEDWLIFNAFFCYREFFDVLGGFDSIYESPTLAHADLAIRAQRIGYKAKLSAYPITITNWMPDTSGDHAPIHFAMAEHDIPIFFNKYSQPSDISTVYLKPDSWKESENIWRRRFKM